MMHIKTFEKMRYENIRESEFSVYLFPISINNLSKMVEYLNKQKMYFDFYENGVKFLKLKPLDVKDFLLYIEEPSYGNKLNLIIKKDSLRFKHKSQITKWVGAKVKDIDLYMNANKYNL